MKDATGEMSMTVIVIIAAAAILLIGKAIWPMIEERIKGEVNDIGSSAYVIDYDEFYNA